MDSGPTSLLARSIHFGPHSRKSPRGTIKATEENQPTHTSQRSAPDHMWTKTGLWKPAAPFGGVVGGGWTNEELEVGRAAACAPSGGGTSGFLASILACGIQGQKSLAGHGEGLKCPSSGT